MNGNQPPNATPPQGWAGYPPAAAPVALSRGALFFQAIRGPIVLITLGLLFWVHQAGIVSFSRTWPVLIIVIGLLKLLERLAMPRNIPPGAQYR